MVGLLISLDVEERVAVPHLGLPRRAQWDRGRLAVPDQHVAGLVNQVGGASQSVQTLDAW